MSGRNEEAEARSAARLFRRCNSEEPQSSAKSASNCSNGARNWSSGSPLAAGVDSLALAVEPKAERADGSVTGMGMQKLRRRRQGASRTPRQVRALGPRPRSPGRAVGIRGPRSPFASYPRGMRHRPGLPMAGRNLASGIRHPVSGMRLHLPMPFATITVIGQPRLQSARLTRACRLPAGAAPCRRGVVGPAEHLPATRLVSKHLPRHCNRSR